MEFNKVNNYSHKKAGWNVKAIQYLREENIHAVLDFTKHDPEFKYSEKHNDYALRGRLLLRGDFIVRGDKDVLYVESVIGFKNNYIPNEPKN